MYRSEEVEYCNLDLRFDRRRIRALISDLIEEGYSLYWNENEHQFMIAIRSGRKLIKLKFEKHADRYKMIGTYSIKDQRLAELIEKMINDTRGHAVVKRFRDRQILIENIMFGEVIRTVEINGIEHKVLFERQGASITADTVMAALRSERIEARAPALLAEIDEALLELSRLLEEGQPEEIERCKARLSALHKEKLLAEL